HASLSLPCSLRRALQSQALVIFCFFFSSRRRHTRFSRDWSSDVCSSDLPRPDPLPPRRGHPEAERRRGRGRADAAAAAGDLPERDRKSTRLNSSHVKISYAVFCLKKKKNSRKNFVQPSPAPRTRSGHTHR